MNQSNLYSAKNHNQVWGADDEFWWCWRCWWWWLRWWWWIRL